MYVGVSTPQQSIRERERATESKRERERERERERLFVCMLG